MSIKAVDAALAGVFGRYSQQWQPTDPLQQLILTVLGQRTTRAHARQALANLRAIRRGWEGVAALPHDTLADLIRPAGLALQKAAWVHGILEQVLRDNGAYCLDSLHRMDSETASRCLCRLPGVGAHSAALVLLFALGRPGVMPVDGHVHRVARRLGWAPPGATPHAVQQAIEAAAPTGNLMDLHVNLIRLGHRHCGPGTPGCPDCPIGDLCPAARLQPWW